MPGDPFTLPFAHQTRLIRAAFTAARPLVSSALRLRTLRETYDVLQRCRGGERFESRVLRAFEMRFEVRSGSAHVPAAGAVIFAANHPTGIRDGLVLLEAVRRVRPDVRMLASHWLSGFAELVESCFFVDPFGGPAAAARSRAGLRAAHLWLRGGGALIVFPAGEVAHSTAHAPSAAEKSVADASGTERPGEAGASGASLSEAPEGTAAQRRRRAPNNDSRWQPTVGRLALATDARVVPVFLDGRNSRAFVAAGRVHPLLRTLLLGREFVAQRGTTAGITFGQALTAEALRAAGGTPDQITRRIRAKVEALSTRAASSPPFPIERPVDAALVARDVEALPADARLLTSGAYDVFCADAASLPHVLREIGRLREEAFRDVGEGTGRPIDLDRFDAHYQHLFVWHGGRGEIVGAYRVGATDEILRAHGLAGLYTRTLFTYDARLLDRFGPALELGRSFVRRDYQRSYSALLLLWMGLGRFVARSPRYRVLFGPVSISRRYSDASQALLRAFLAQRHRDAALEPLVRPMNPPVEIDHSDAGGTPADVAELDDRIRRLEGGCGMPVLLRQYLRLNARLLGFNVDPAFGQALDALMMVDVAELPPAVVRQYFGVQKLRATGGSRAA